MTGERMEPRVELLMEKEKREEDTLKDLLQEDLQEGKTIHQNFPAGS